MKHIQKLTAALITVFYLINLTACDNSEPDPPIDTTFPEITPPVTSFQTIAQTTPPIETEHSVTTAVSTTLPIYDQPYQVHRDTEITYKMNEEDEEVRAIIYEIFDNAKWLIDFENFPEEYSSLYPSGSVSTEDLLRIYFNEDDYKSESISVHGYLPLGKLPYSTIADLRECFLRCFSKSVTDSFLDSNMTKVEKISEKKDKFFLARLSDIKEITTERFLEMEGMLYTIPGIGADYITSDFSKIRVLERTNDKIIFAYLAKGRYYDSDKLYACRGVLVNEDGWKFGWYCDSSNDEYIDFNSTWLS